MLSCEICTVIAWHLYLYNLDGILSYCINVKNLKKMNSIKYHMNFTNDTQLINHE